MANSEENDTLTQGGDEFEFMARKVVKVLIETAKELEGFQEPFRSGGISALEEFYYRMCGKHFDWEQIKDKVQPLRSTFDSTQQGG